MILYHTSTQVVPEPDVKYSREYLDFGKGFYLTAIREQAVKYGNRFKRRNRDAWLNIYELKEEDGFFIKEFTNYDVEWLNFVAACRAGKDISSYDIVIGGIADDEVIRTIERYFNGEITKEEALGLLIYKEPNMQYCIRTQSIIDKCLIFKGAERL